MSASASLISCNFPSFNPKPSHKPSNKPNPLWLTTPLSSSPLPTKPITWYKLSKPKNQILHFDKKPKRTQICFGSENPVGEREDPGNNGGGIGDWATSILLSVFWGAVLYYVFNLSPNQTPSRDMYFLKKLSNLVGDDGFRMNKVLVSLWYIMGLWPVVYSMLLLPSGRSSKSKIPVWPFATLSFFGGAYALIPYFILWRPPPPPVKEGELSKWPLNFLESKVTAGLLGAAGLGLILYAGLSYDDWKEFYQYFRESKLVHATSLDFSLLSAFAPFWVYNDMTVRKCYDKTAWLLPLSIIPFVGPALYLLLRPPLKTMPTSLESTLKSD